MPEQERALAEHDAEQAAAEDEEPPTKPAGLVDMKGGNKHTPTKRKVFPSKMNRNKRMP